MSPFKLYNDQTIRQKFPGNEVDNNCLSENCKYQGSELLPIITCLSGRGFSMNLSTVLISTFV